MKGDRPSRSWLVNLYPLLGVGIVGGYLWAATTGWEPAGSSRATMPQSVRSSPGGYRSFHFWHSGYRGGK